MIVCPALAHPLPSALPTFPAPITAIFMFTNSSCRVGAHREPFQAVVITRRADDLAGWGDVSDAASATDSISANFLPRARARFWLLTGQSDHRRHATMRRAFVHLQLFFCEDHILEAGECLFQRWPRVELVELLRAPCPIRRAASGYNPG